MEIELYILLWSRGYEEAAIADRLCGVRKDEIHARFTGEEVVRRTATGSVRLKRVPLPGFVPPQRLLCIARSTAELIAGNLGSVNTLRIGFSPHLVRLGIQFRGTARLYDYLDLHLTVQS